MTNAVLTDTRSTYPRRWWAFAVLCCSVLLIGLDNTILNVALPTLVKDLSATTSQLQWIVDAYVLVFAGLLLTTGSLSDRYGRKGALMVGMLIFGTGSIWAALSNSAEMLIAARAFMGIGGALIMPATLSITTNMFDAKERGRAIGLWAGVVGIGIVLGPVLGGWLLERFAWGSVFLINLPVVAAAVAFGLFLIPESRDPAATPIDPVGALLSIAGLTALLYGIIEVPVDGWTASNILIAFGAAAVLLLAFIGWELRARYPMLDVRLFRNMRFTAASLALTLTSFALFGSLFFLTQYLQFVLGYSAFEAGYRIIPLAAGLMIGAPLSARISERLGAKITVTVGLAVVASGLALLSTASTSSGYELVAAVLAILGFGLGCAMAPATDSIMGALPLAKAGVGSAVNDTTRQVGGALGVAVLGSLLSAAYRGSMENLDLVKALPAEAAKAVSESVGAAIAVAQKIGGPVGEALANAARHHFIDGMDQTVLIAAGVALAGALVALLFLPGRAAPKPVDEPAAIPDKSEEVVNV